MNKLTKTLFLLLVVTSASLLADDLHDNFIKIKDFKSWSVYHSSTNDYIAMQPLRDNKNFGFTCIEDECSFFIATKKEAEKRSFVLSSESFNMTVDSLKKIKRIIKNETFNLYLIPTSQLMFSKLSQDDNLWLIGASGFRDGLISNPQHYELSGSYAALLYIIDNLNLVGENFYSSNETKVFKDLAISSLEFGDPMRARFDYNENNQKNFSVEFKKGMWSNIDKLEKAGLDNASVVFTYENGAYIKTTNSEEKVFIEDLGYVPCYAENNTQKRTCDNLRFTWSKLLVKDAEQQLAQLIKGDEKYKQAINIIKGNFEEDLKAIETLNISSAFLYKAYHEKLKSIFNELEYR